MDKEKIVSIVVKIVAVVLIIVAVIVYYQMTEKRLIKEQEALELRMKQLRKK